MQLIVTVFSVLDTNTKVAVKILIMLLTQWTNLRDFTVVLLPTDVPYRQSCAACLIVWDQKPESGH